MAIRYQIVYWRDIPAQIKIKDGRKRKGQPLSDRFTQGIVTDQPPRELSDKAGDVFFAPARIVEAGKMGKVGIKAFARIVSYDLLFYFIEIRFGGIIGR